MNQRLDSAMPSAARRLPGAPLLGAWLLMASAPAAATPIDPDLSITGSVALSTTIGQSPFSDGNVTQSGAIRTTVGGTTTSAAFSTSPGTADGADDGTTSLPSPNPLSAVFTDTGDGVGWSTDLDAAFQTGFNFNDGYDFIIDSSISLANASLTDTFTIIVQVAFSHSADADGADAFGDLGLDVELDDLDQVNSDLASDTLLGDELNGVRPGTSGALISQTDTQTFNVILTPGGAALVTGLHQWEGGVFDNPGASLVDVSADITILDISCSGPCGGVPPQPAPEPGTLALLGLALPGLALLRRRTGLPAA